MRRIFKSPHEQSVASAQSSPRRGLPFPSQKSSVLLIDAGSLREALTPRRSPLPSFDEAVRSPAGGRNSGWIPAALYQRTGERILLIGQRDRRFDTHRLKSSAHHLLSGTFVKLCRDSSVTASRSNVTPDQIGRLLADHDGSRIGIGAHETGHHRTVADANAV
jgi:hypothetical protein